MVQGIHLIHENRLYLYPSVLISDVAFHGVCARMIGLPNKPNLFL